MNIQPDEYTEFLQGIPLFNDPFAHSFSSTDEVLFLLTKFENYQSIIEKFNEIFHSLQNESIRVRRITNHLEK